MKGFAWSVTRSRLSVLYRILHRRRRYPTFLDSVGGMASINAPADVGRLICARFYSDRRSSSTDRRAGRLVAQTFGVVIVIQNNRAGAARCLIAKGAFQYFRILLQ